MRNLIIKSVFVGLVIFASILQSKSIVTLKDGDVDLRIVLQQTTASAEDGGYFYCVYHPNLSDCYLSQAPYSHCVGVDC